MQPTVTNTLWLPADALAGMAGEADRAAPLETGGVLLGYWAAGGRDAVVTDVVGPGPGARHGADSFLPDQSFHEAEIARRYAAAGRRLHYLGDWHTHPGAPPYLSDTDLRTLRRIGVARRARAPRPVMLVLGFGPAWETAAWEGRVVRLRLRLRRTLVTEALTVRVFERPRTSPTTPSADVSPAPSGTP